MWTVPELLTKVAICATYYTLWKLEFIYNEYIAIVLCLFTLAFSFARDNQIYYRDQGYRPIPTYGVMYAVSLGVVWVFEKILLAVLTEHSSVFGTEGIFGSAAALAIFCKGVTMFSTFAGGGLYEYGVSSFYGSQAGDYRWFFQCPHCGAHRPTQDGPCWNCRPDAHREYSIRHGRAPVSWPRR